MVREVVHASVPSRTAEARAREPDHETDAVLYRPRAVALAARPQGVDGAPVALVPAPKPHSFPGSCVARACAH